MIDDALIWWLANGERGISSNSIVQALTGIPTLQGWPMGHPQDPGDFRRCLLLLDACPSLTARFGEMRAVSRQWRALVDIWPTLVDTFEAEFPRWRDRDRRGSAPITYGMMRSAIDSAEKVGRDG